MSRLIFLFFVLFLPSCDNARVEQLENENHKLRKKLDSVYLANEKATKFAQEAYEKAKLRAEEVKDSVITARDLKVVMVYGSCGDDDADQDLNRSIDLIVDKLKSYSIEVYKQSDPSMSDFSCGYILANGGVRKQIDGAMTDYDLALLISEFYSIDVMK